MDMKTARKRAGLTENQLAQCTGLSQTMLSFFETGKKFPDEQQQLVINRALAADIDWSLHDNAPLSDIENTYLARLYERMIEFDEPQETMKFLANQNHSSLRKMFRLARVDKVVEPMKANGYPEIRRRK